MKRYVCIHGHFYQPPRENPWLEAIELQDSAYPFHDWNERINAECYMVNGRSRLLDHEERIIDITNNYARMSFNFGPTLLSWLEHHAPMTYERILEADRLSMERFSGHGSALAQVYNHMIMPLANRRDKQTQVRWGIADFRRRFGRDPEGMWLPETAVDIETLEVLAEHDIRFTILAPRQASRCRAKGDEHWTDVSDDSIDPTRPYQQSLPSGATITLFFYDGPVSQAIAFERILHSSEAFYERLLGAFPDENGDEDNNDTARLVHIATDGETYGHHHNHGDMALAATLRRLDDDPAVRLTNYGEFLEHQPPEHEVEIIESSSWSCVHGVERWRGDCGCHSGMKPEWQQAWRQPLREALDVLRDELADLFEKRAAKLFHDPWAARDGYVQVVLDRSPENVNAFLREHARNDALSSHDRITALRLMELQRNLMLMYTSCGWFFDELSGIETVQVLHYADRSVQLASQLFDQSPKEEFLEILGSAPSNIPELTNGRTIYERMVEPARVDLEKVGGHYAMSSLFEEYADTTKIFCFSVESQVYRRRESGRSRLVIGRARVTSTVTEESSDLSFGVIHLGDHNLLSSVRQFRSENDFDELARDIEEAFDRADTAETIQRLNTHFGEHQYSLRYLFRDEQRKILDVILDSTMKNIEHAYRQVYDDHFAMMRALGGRGVPIPSVLRTTAEFIVNLDLKDTLSNSDVDVAQVHSLLTDIKDWRLELDNEGIGFAFQQTLERVAQELRDHPTELEWLQRLNLLADLTRSLPFEVDLWLTQNVYFDLLKNVYPDRLDVADQEEDAGKWVEQFRSLGEKLKVKVD